MDVIPRHNLPPESAPWGTRLQRQQDDLVTAQGRSDQTTNNTLKQLNATVSALQQQIVDLQNTVLEINKRITYVNSSGPNLTFASSTSAISAGVPITFTISETRKVILTASGTFGSTVFSTTPSSNNGSVSASLTVYNGSFISANLVAVTNYVNSLSNSAVATITTQYQSYSSVVAQNMIILQAGTYTLTPAVALTLAGNVSGSVAFNNPTFVVQVLEQD